MRRVDSLNHVAYALRYNDVDSSFFYARQAYELARHDRLGKAEAANNLGFCAVMRVDFAAARSYYNEVQRLTKNELERLIADIGMMKICQRQAMNKEFYDYRNSARTRLRRINEEDELFTAHQQMRLLYARSEFHIVSAIYYYYVQQRPKALASINRIDVGTLAADTGQLLFYHYIKGSTGLGDGNDADERLTAEFDELYQTWRMAVGSNNLFFEANGMQGLANLMVSEANFEFFRNRRSYALHRFDTAVDSLLPLHLAQQALEKFKRYGNRYQIAGTYITLGRYLNRHGRYEEALDTLDKALACAGDTLNPVPDVVSRIHEQLSVSYAGLGMKPESDAHRNIYLDILDDTRQDREQESRYQALQVEAEQLNILTLVVSAGFVVVALLFWAFARRSKVRERKYHDHLRQLIDTACTTWMNENETTALSLGDELRRLEKQRYVHEQHIVENKRQNVVKKACLSIVNGITPYIDRILNETRKLPAVTDSAVKWEKYHYIDELITAINEYNDILDNWIKVRQGSLQLNIETFALNDLFDLIRKGSRAFEMKQQLLEVVPTEADVKADRALTLFMINTLAENARKYTPQGGTVKVYAAAHAAEAEAGGYVEISVEDNGYGLTEEEVARIMDEKVYDSQAIGSGEEEIRKNKGSGFGLMNCKGIIDKYRKVSSAFAVCRFGVESRAGTGSRFYFRLPVGVRRTLGVLLVGLLLPHSLVHAAPQQEKDDDAYEMLLNRASDYANDAYYSNLAGTFEQTLLYVDSAMVCLNAHCREYAHLPLQMLSLTGHEEPAELGWWNSTFNSDFHVILDIRNEAAVAFLSLHQWDEYTYNNNAYTTLYKLLGEDRSLEAYCNELERSTSNRMVGIILFVVLVCALLLGYYLIYVRRRLLNRWNLEQVLEINHRIFAAASFTAESNIGAEERLKQTPHRIVEASFAAINEVIPITQMYITVHDSAHDAAADTFTPEEEGMENFPLVVNSDEETRCVGMLHIRLRDDAGTEYESARLLLELVARYIAIVVFNAVVRLGMKYRDIETAYDETARASHEDGLLHVQNMVLDNCLSTIKHETIYYPNKIKQLVARLLWRDEPLPPPQEAETVKAIGELIEYYKGIFTILSRCASRQLEEVTFRRSHIDVQALLADAQSYFAKAVAKGDTAVTLTVDEVAPPLTALGDITLLRYLQENLIGEALAAKQPGNLHLQAVADGEYVRFVFTDHRRQKSDEELAGLFYPSLKRGAEYLLCKQIIRDHDEYIGRRGCRINAEQAEDGGFKVYYTIPILTNKNL
jgi:signal transduction histidine kinase